MEDSLWSFSDAEDSFDFVEGSSTFVEHSILEKNDRKILFDDENNLEKKKELHLNKVKNNILNINFSVEDACNLVKKAFRAASEREISVGDGLEIWVLKKNRNDCDSIDNDNIDENLINLNDNKYVNDRNNDDNNDSINDNDNINDNNNDNNSHNITDRDNDNMILNNMANDNGNKYLPEKNSNNNFQKKRKYRNFREKIFRIEKLFYSLPFH